MDLDPFDDLLGLEERFYNEGFQLGSTDGARAGKIEGRVFGLENGFEKYVESGRLYGRSVVWAARLSKSQERVIDTRGTSKASNSKESNAKQDSSTHLPDLPQNSRLEKHIKVLHALTEPASLSTDNSEDAVSDFDDRLKRAAGKVKIIEQLIGEHSTAPAPVTLGLSDTNIEDVDILKARH